jgi:outer membrane protein TolC
MSLMANAKYESLRDSKLQTAFNIQKVWYEIYQISQQIEIAKDNHETLKSIERLAITRYKTTPTGNSAGSAPVISQNSRSNSSPQSMGSMEQANNGNITSNVPDAGMNSSSMGTTGSSFGLPDIYRIQIEIGDLRNNMAYLESQLKVLVAQLNSYMNRPSGSIIVSPDTLIADSLKYPLHLVKDSMLVNNPMLAMLNFEKQSLEARKKMVSKMGYPMIGLGLNYTIIKKDEMSQEKMNGKDMVMPMISTTIPIYRKKYKSMKNEADYLIQASQSNMEATAHALEVEFEQAVQLYEDALRRRQLYDEQRKLSQKSLDIMFKKFSASSADLTDVLRFRQQVLDYGFKYTEALVDLKTSEAWINRLSGGFIPNY